MTAYIHQLLHGYRNGHKMLAGSLRLKGEAADLIDRLSDLSGALIPNAKIDPYLTIYPIPDSGFYGVANTWIDPAGPRSGCVLTHTLLVPTAIWSRDPDPSWLAGCLRGPVTHRNLDDYKSPVIIPSGQPVVVQSRRALPTTIERQFTQRFFKDGIRPIIWFDCETAQQMLWAIVRFLWPSMREAFSSSTNCLQPRIAVDGPFHLMFATSAARPRFQQFPTQALLSPANKKAFDESSISDLWIEALAKGIFCPTAAGPIEPEMAAFGEFLDSDPTAIRRLFLVSDLKNRLHTAPTAGIGLLDAIEALIPDPGAGKEIKFNALSQARLAASHGTPDESLRCYYLLSDRLRRPAFEKSANDIADAIQNDVREFVVAHPQLGISEQNRVSLSSASESPSWYFNGLLDGLAEIARATPVQLLALCENDNLAVAAINARPSIAAAFLSLSSNDGIGVATMLAKWIHAIRDHESRTSLRRQLFPRIEHDFDIPVLVELLNDIESSDVSWTLEALSNPTRGFGLSAARRVIKEQVAERFPEQTREWAFNSPVWSKGAAEVIAASFSLNANGADQLLNNHYLEPLKHVELWVAFIDRFDSKYLPNWLVSYAANHGAVVVPFVRAGLEMPKRVSQSFAKVLARCNYIPIVLEAGVIPQLERINALPCFELLIDRTMQSVLREFVVGRLNLSGLREALGQSWATSWLRRTSGAHIVQQTTYSEDAEQWQRCWRCVENLPDIVYEQSPPIIPDIMRSLMRSNVTNWTLSSAESWRTILIRASSTCDAATQLRLCADALRFCFYNNHLPLGAVAAYAFPPVYSAVANSREAPSETAELYSYYDWDKAKTLRKDFINAFMSSNWPPGDLGLAAIHSGLARKIFNRIRRKWRGDDFVTRMCADLRNRADPESVDAADSFQAMSDDFEFYEPWD